MNYEDFRKQGPMVVDTPEPSLEDLIMFYYKTMLLEGEIPEVHTRIYIVKFLDGE